jgi:GAF domain-containing protein
MNYDDLKRSVFELLADSNNNRDQKLQAICQLLYDEINYYNWVGFYFSNHKTKTLHLGPYVGESTDHIIIPFGKGICGQVAISNQNFIVSDVAAQDNYIACSTAVRSEIVVPIFVEGKNIGQIDIDSYTIDIFTENDTKFLAFVNSEVAKLF